MPTYTPVIDGYKILAAVGFDVLQPIQGGLAEPRYRTSSRGVWLTQTAVQTY